MKKSYSWQFFLIVLAAYLILLAFIPQLGQVFDYIRLSLLIALGLLWAGTEYKNAILFCLGLAFSAFYIRDITSYWYVNFNGAALFFGLLVLGIAIHSIQKKRSKDSFTVHVDYEEENKKTDTGPIFSSDKDHFIVNNKFSDRREQATSQQLRSVSISSFAAHTVIDLGQADFEKENTYLTIQSNFSSTIIYLPRHVEVISHLSPSLSETSFPLKPNQTTKKLYLTGQLAISSLTIQYIN